MPTSPPRPLPRFQRRSCPPTQRSLGHTRTGPIERGHTARRKILHMKSLYSIVRIKYRRNAGVRSLSEEVRGAVTVSSQSGGTSNSVVQPKLEVEGGPDTGVPKSSMLEKLENKEKELDHCFLYNYFNFFVLFVFIRIDFFFL